ncbi:unnamed protein product [Miscanthus lutarioriparius]|uniref:DUF3615 domain-containing protein n=1 Tax=Miscanthus lutarioriparius TaxID=422564 RepID=A0A811MWK2_9POAL|nr:unnamed protein product [Miscanthus lutarioriparius]
MAWLPMPPLACVLHEGRQRSSRSLPPHPMGAPLPPAQYSSPGEDGSSRASVEAESPPRDIKRSVDDEPSPTRRVKSRSPPESPQKQLVALPPPEAAAGVTLHPPEVGTPAQHGGAGEDGTEDGSIAELGIKLFPCLPRDQAAALWVGFVNDAKTCIKQYNIKHKVNFVYKHEPSNVFYRVEEQDGRAYYHTNFYAQDEYGHSQLFFGEIKECVRPQVEDVTCCCPVSSSDTGI